jgi:hypothetical protein
MRSSRSHTTEKQKPLQCELWTNKNVAEFCASATTPAAFPNSQQSQWSTAEMCGEYANTRNAGLPEHSVLYDNPARSKNASDSSKQR